LRLYEREGLIAAPPRTTGGYRLYPADSVDRLAVIRVVKALGFSLSEIRDLIDLLEGEGLGDKDLRALAAKRIAMIDEKMAGLADLRACLVDCMENPDGPGDEECAAIMRLFRDRPPRRMEEKAPTRRRRAAR
jgi:DNA-binding transcriptional MerR regulator